MQDQVTSEEFSTGKLIHDKRHGRERKRQGQDQKPPPRKSSKLRLTMQELSTKSNPHHNSSLDAFKTMQGLTLTHT